MKSSFVSNSVLVHNQTMAEKGQQIRDKIDELKEKISRNKFINDMYWRERSDDNVEYQAEINKLEKQLI